MANDWISIIQSKIHSRIKSELYDELVVKYPNIYFTTSNKSLSTPKFPTVKTRVISMPEQGQDLEGKTINAVLAGVQIDVTTNVSENEAQTVAYKVLGVLKQMGFDISQPPIATIENDVYRSITRGNRMIGSGDSL